MFKIEIPTVIDFSKIKQDFIRANDYAIVEAAARAVGPVKAAMPVKTGVMMNEVGIKFFRRRNLLKGASIKVIGKRHFVANILENGTRDGRIKARHTFEHVSASIEALMVQVYQEAFFRKLEELGRK
jgi:hypothetical protein